MDGSSSPFFVCWGGLQLHRRETLFAVIYCYQHAEIMRSLWLPPGPLLKSLCPWHVEFFRFVPSSRCQNIWFSFGEIFVVIFPSGINYCHWNINGCPAGLIDFICAPSYLWSETDKSELCFAGTFLKRPQAEQLTAYDSKDDQITDLWDSNSNLQRRWLCYLNNLAFIEKIIYHVPKLIP